MKYKRMWMRALAVLAAVLLTLGFAAPAHAVISTDKGSIELGNIEAGAQVNAYRIIDVKWDDVANAPSSPEYDWDASAAAWLKTQTAEGYDKYVAADESVTEAYKGADAAFFDALAAAVKGGTVSLTPAATVTATGQATTLTNLSMGSYLVLVSNSTNYVYQPIVANLVPQSVDGAWVLNPAAVTIDAKRRSIDIDKTVEGDSSTNAQIGDTVEFVITADVPKYPASAVAKKFAVSDTFSNGLTLNAGSIRVFGMKGDAKTELTAGAHYVLATENAQDLSGKDVTFSVNFSDYYDAVASYDKVRIEYSAVLNENALVGGAGNKNDAKLEWNNDPYDQNGHIDEETPDVTPVVYTYGLRVDKVDKADQNLLLPGAVFMVKAGGADLSFIAKDEAAGHYRVAKAGESGAVKEVKVGADGNAAKGKLTIDGLDEGDLTLTETHAPAGYAVAHDPFKVTITDADGGVLDGVVAESNNGDGYAYAKVENSKGFALPTTGGVGTVAITAAGVLVMAGAGLYLVRSRKQQ